ncbi:helix-turn-helix transcriptional regulator [Actinocorallia lasiicapitis]
MSELQPSNAAKKAFGIRLKDMRLDADLSGVALARQWGWHKSKVSKIEHGIYTPSEDDIRKWATACGAEDQVPELIAANRQIEQMWSEWRRELRAGQKHIQARGLTRYAATRLLRVYEPLVIPSSLQTLGYATAVLTINARVHGLPLGDVEEAARNRVARQELVTSGTTNTYNFILEASALRVIYGSVSTMLEQLDFLEQIAGRPNVAFGIIPFTVQRTQFAGEGFYLFDEREVRQEFWSGAFRSSRVEDIAYFGRVFSFLRDQAVYGQEARTEIETARRQLQQPGATP